MIKEAETKSDQPSEGLAKLYDSWGVFEFLQPTLDELPPSYLKILNIARNLLDGRPIPGVTIPKSLMGLLERDRKIVYDRRYVTRQWQEKTILPSDNIDIRPIQTLSELPQVLPANRLLQEVAPDLFAYNALTGNLPIAEPQKPQVRTEEKSETLEELVPRVIKGSSPRQKVYSLMDVSLSMGDGYKLISAKSVMLAYLIKAHEENAQLFFRAFAGGTSDRIDCLTPAQFAPLARTILKYGLFSGTNAARALSFAIQDIRAIDRIQGRERAQTEILLISDCETQSGVPDIPRNITLHTLHLTGRTEGYYQEGWYRNQLHALRDRSATFTSIDTSGLRLPGAVEEAWLMREELRNLNDMHGGMGFEEMERDQKFQKRVGDLKQLSGVYKKMYGGESNKIANEAQKLQRQVSRHGVKERIMEKLKQAMNLKQQCMVKLRQLRLPHSPKLTGTLFDFRLKE